MTQVGDIPAAMKKWKGIIKKNPDMKCCRDLEALGGTVFAFAHLIETRQVIGTAFCDDKSAQKISVPEMAAVLRNKHACTFYIWSEKDDSVSFEAHFVYSQDKTKVISMVCADHTTGMIGFLTDFTMLPTVLSQLMKLDTQIEKSENFPKIK